ncbi:MAG: NAD-dependent epimerase/dehydratase family protein [Actinomycetota bacterium]|nr:NAD-dependent epimerase/dehydratase family protein [Actinomycetota bacterium]
MRVVILGGTRFIGRAVVEELVARGHDVLVVHRGQHEPPDLAPVEHLHADRTKLRLVRGELNEFRPDAAVDVSAMNGAQADAALRALPDGIRLVALSSGDVYRAFASVHSGIHTDAVPLDETAPLRERRFLVAPHDENLEVEERYLARGAVILRLGAVYGEHDYQRRQEFVLRRVRARRRRMPIGDGAFLFSRCYVVAVAVRLALEHGPSGEIFNVAEQSTWSMRLLAEKVVQAAVAKPELVTVNAALLPADLRITALSRQHLLMDSHKIRSLGWRDTDADEALRQTVAWDLAHPPRGGEVDGTSERLGGEPDEFEADDAALASVSE